MSGPAITVPMAVVPTCALAYQPAVLRSMVAQSASFQIRRGANNPADAARGISAGALRGEDEIAAVGYPLAVIETARFGYEEVASYMMRPLDGALFLVLEDRDGFPTDREASAADFRNFVGGVAADLAAMQGQDDGNGNPLLAFKTISLAAPLEFSSLRDNNPAKNYWTAVLMLELLRI
jgi:hypothetical protein